MPNFFQRLFGYKPRVDCPICRTSVEKNVRKCPNCNAEIPLEYSENFETAPPISVPIIGETRHGKSAYIWGLMHAFSEVPSVWTDFFTESANPFTLDLLTEIQTSRAENRPPFATDLANESDEEWKMKPRDALVLLIKHIPLWGNRLLVLRDVAGELYNGRENRFTFHESQKEFCQRSPCAILVLDPTAIKKSPDFSFDRLFKAYVRSLKDAGAKVENESRKVVVVFSKADFLSEMLPPNMFDYIQNDPLRAVSDKRGNVDEARALLNSPSAMHNYVRSTLTTVDEHLRKWMREHRGGNEFLAMAKDYGIDLRFTITSAWGQDPEQKMKMLPKRVLDPFIWLLEFHSEEK